MATKNKFSTNKNPIFLEYYPHSQCKCFKILNPFTAYAEEKIVLCAESDGIEAAKELAREVLMEKLEDALCQNFG